MIDMEKFPLLYHNDTGTYWTNDDDWKAKMKESKYLYKYVNVDTDNLFALKQVMNNNGYRLVKDSELRGTAFKNEYKHNNEG